MVDGTSYAAPMVAATAAMIKGANPNLTVSQVKDLLVYSAKPIQSDQKLGPAFSNVNIPNVRSFDMHRALEIAVSMVPGNIYLRVFNTDAFTELYINGPLSERIRYKEDKLIHLVNQPGGATYQLRTYNEDCYYSWGYQIWYWQGPYPSMVYEKTAGVAGKFNPENSSVIKGDWITYQSYYSFAY